MKKGKTGLFRLVCRWLDLKTELRAFSRKKQKPLSVTA
jgi:hypothetical protein